MEHKSACGGAKVTMNHKMEWILRVENSGNLLTLKEKGVILNWVFILFMYT